MKHGIKQKNQTVTISRKEEDQSVNDYEEQVKILANFAHNLASNTVDLPEDIARTLNKHFWEIYEPF